MLVLKTLLSLYPFKIVFISTKILYMMDHIIALVSSIPILKKS